MELEITTPAILFPAISLLTLAYTNKFLALASIIRQLTSNIDEIKSSDKNFILQVDNLLARINLLRHIQTQGLLSIVSCLISIIFLYAKIDFLGNTFFIFSIGFMTISIILAIREVRMSGKALEIHLKRIKWDQYKH